MDADAEVVRASVADPTRFEAIFDRHHTRIWRYLAGVAGPAAADECDLGGWASSAETGIAFTHHPDPSARTSSAPWSW